MAFKVGDEVKFRKNAKIIAGDIFWMPQFDDLVKLKTYGKIIEITSNTLLRIDFYQNIQWYVDTKWMIKKRKTTKRITVSTPFKVNDKVRLRLDAPSRRGITAWLADFEPLRQNRTVGTVLSVSNLGANCFQILVAFEGRGAIKPTAWFMADHWLELVIEKPNVLIKPRVKIVF